MARARALYMKLPLCSHGLMSSVHDRCGALDATEHALPERLARLDLNLLVAFDALAREQNVTRAAERLGVTQSAVSHALRRLRTLFGDPLFVRGSGGMVLTPRAEALVVPLRSSLSAVDRALAQSEPFAPARARRTFRLASPDLFDVLAVPLVLAQVRAEAPGIDLVVMTLEERRRALSLESGEVDVVITPRVDDVSAGTSELDRAGLVRRLLFRDGFSCFLRARHPALGAKGRRRNAAATLSLDAYAALPHALVSPRGEGRSFVDELLAQQGLSRRVALRVPHFFSALAMVENSDLILTAPTALGRLLPARSAVVSVPAPLRLPRHALHMVWHERFSNEPGHAWLRNILQAVCKTVGS
jgi:DNA-binding transcriptional LysR family regulator